MPTKTYYLDDAQTDAITAKWGMFFRNFEVSHNGQPLGPAASAGELGQGLRYSLPDGRIFSAQLLRNQGLRELELLLDGRPLPGSGTHPHERIRQAWYVLLFVAVLSVGLGLVALFGQVEVLLQLGLGWASIVEGLIFLALGWLGYSRRSVAALAVALVLLVLDGVLSIGSAIADGHSPAAGGLITRFFFCVLVFRGLQAARQLRAEAADLVAE